MRAIASAEARETMMCMGVVSLSGFYREKQLDGRSGAVADGEKRTHPCQQLDAVALDAVQTARLVQFLDGDGLGGVEAALVYPRLDPVEVDGRLFDFESLAHAVSSCWPETPMRTVVVAAAAGTHGLYTPLPLSGRVMLSGVWPPSKPAGTFPCACWPF